MRRGVRKYYKLMIRRRTVRMLKLDWYFDVFIWSKACTKIGETGFNKVLLYIMPNCWISKAYMQVLYDEDDTFKLSINMFGCMEISDDIYEGIVEPSKFTREEATCSG